jgi:carboxyl-terminal processing protease
MAGILQVTVAELPMPLLSRTFMKLSHMTARLHFIVALALFGSSVSFGGRASSPPDTHGTDANLVRVTATLLEQSQFSHHPIDRELAAKWLDRYLDDLDGRHSLFLQSDVDELRAYLPAMVEATHGEGKISVPRAIFARLLKRMGQQLATFTADLSSGSFVFTGHDRYSVDRSHAPRPTDLATAKGLWHEHVRAEYLQEKLSGKKPAEIVRLLTRRHNQQVKTMRDLGDDEILQVYLDALSHVYDPHSNYLGRQEMENMAIGMNLSLVGIGASLRLVDGYCTIHELIPGGPGARSGKLKPGDRIVAVAQARGEPVDVVDMPLTRTVEMIRGPKGTRVTLTILPAGTGDGGPAKTVTLVRDRIKLEDQAAKAFIVDLPTGASTASTLRLGVVDLPSFYAELQATSSGKGRSATVDVTHLLTKLNAEHVRGLILDLRRNGGGALEEAVQLTGLFIKEGPVVQTRDLKGGIDVDQDEDARVLYDGPLVVLTSRFSASASEILAGALQDYGRALVVGDSSTFGKGTVQNIVLLGPIMDQMGLGHSYDPGALLITIRKFYRPSGASTQLRGVKSDIVLPSLTDLADVSESSLPDPLPWDTVPPLHFEHLNRVQPYLPALAAESAKRLKQDADFRLLGEAIAQLRKDLASKSISLNEEERRQAVAKSKAIADRLQKERRKEPTAQARVYAITLANASAPGLPAATTSTAAKPPEDQEADLEGLGDGGNGHLPADEMILEESEHILADYVQRLGAK